MRFDYNDEIWREYSDKWNSKTQAWKRSVPEVTGPIPEAMINYQMCVVGNRLIIAGGDSQEIGIRNGLWVFHLLTGEFEK